MQPHATTIDWLRTARQYTAIVGISQNAAVSSAPMNDDARRSASGVCLAHNVVADVTTQARTNRSFAVRAGVHQARGSSPGPPLSAPSSPDHSPGTAVPSDVRTTLLRRSQAAP